MRCATLQFAPRLGDISGNIERANALLTSGLRGQSPIDLLVLPELALTGYNFPTSAAIEPLLEPTAAGTSTIWAKNVAAKYNCVVTIGYPELCTDSLANGSWDTTGDRSSETRNGNASHSDGSSTEQQAKDVTAYNSTVTVSPTGFIVAHYRKTHLYYTDEVWAKESPSGFTTTTLSVSSADRSAQPNGSSAIPGVGETRKVAWAICMDLNNYRFTAPWDAYEFSTAALNAGADTVLLSTAWLTSIPLAELQNFSKQPDLDTWAYWIQRLSPLVSSQDREVVVICANRCGQEPGPCLTAFPSSTSSSTAAAAEKAQPFSPPPPESTRFEATIPTATEGENGEAGGVRYAGTSWIGKVGGGKVEVGGMMGRNEEGVLIVDFEAEGWAKSSYVFRPRGEDSAEEDSANENEDWEDEVEDTDGKDMEETIQPGNGAS